MTDADPPTGPLAAPAVTKNGGRVELRLNRQSEQEVEYSARFFTGEGEIYQAALRRTTDGNIQVVWQGREAPAWLVEFTLALVQTTARTTKSGSWPRRLTRWRKAPKS